MSKIALIGGGRMGGALASGWVASGVAPKDILIIDPVPGEQAITLIAQGVRHATTITSADCAKTKIAVLAIKPQMFGALSQEIEASLPKDAAVLSILAGTSMRALSAAFKGRALIRAMPNTPAAIGQGISAYFTSSRVTDALATQAEQLLLAGGAVIRVDREDLIDVVTAVSGSGPAYVFYMAEALEAAAIDAGMPEAFAGILARQTLIGAGALLASSAEPASALRTMVTSPGGTTQAALDQLMDSHGLAPLMQRTVRAALKRARELGASEG